MSGEELQELINKADTELLHGNMSASEQLLRQVLDYLAQHDSELLHHNEHIQLQLKALTHLANIVSARGDNARALEYYSTVLSLAESIHYEQGIVAAMCNIGILYNTIGNAEMAQQFLEQALSLATSIGHTNYRANILCNIAEIHYHRQDFVQSMQYYTDSLALYRSENDRNGEALILANMAAIFFVQDEYDKGIEHFEHSLALSKELDNKARVVLNLGNLGMAYQEEQFPGCDFAKAELYLSEALELSTELGSKGNMSFMHQTLATLYKKQSRWEKALYHFEQHLALEKEITTLEAKKIADRIGYERQMAQREKEIELERATTRTTTSLLLKVLPPLIAQRIIEGEEEIADYVPAVSILFADIKGFTEITTAMPPQVVVRFLGYVFGEFDRIMKECGCEKIKTIGDGYMAVAGAPVPCQDHAERIIRAAVNMLNVQSIPPDIKAYFPQSIDFALRIGIHTGAVIAGVVGSERFVYDIYSDAVNIASRMESHGEAGRIHVSEDFVQELTLGNGKRAKDNEQEINVHSPLTLNSSSFTTNNLSLTIIPRGAIVVKGKGTMRTYFLEVQ